jgi:hypothetical protein
MSQFTCSAGPQADVVSYADADLLAQLRAGDEAAMAQLVDQWSPAMRTWSSIGAPSRRDTAPENVVLSKETLLELGRALSGLPTRQRQVVTMRDVCGMSSEEVCAALEISPANQRVLLIAPARSCARPWPGTTVGDACQVGGAAERWMARGGDA